ncbi:MAG: GxxExxY protein [Dehalococcoidia bacterium]
MVNREPQADADDFARRVIGAAIEVHSTLGPGFLESAYEEALSVELRLRAIPFARQVAVELGYKGEAIGPARLDFLVGGRLVVELKSVETLLPVHIVQVRSYRRATGCSLGLLINFNVTQLRSGGIKRVVFSDLGTRMPNLGDLGALGD